MPMRLCFEHEQERAKGKTGTSNNLGYANPACDMPIRGYGCDLFTRMFAISKVSGRTRTKVSADSFH